MARRWRAASNFRPIALHAGHDIMPLCEHLMENYGVIDQRNILDNLLLAGYGRGQTLVDRRDFSGEDMVHGLAGEWTRVEVALDVDAERIARLFLDTLGLTA